LITVGITGHRNLGDDPAVKWSVQSRCVLLLDRLRELAKSEGKSIRAMSSLAIGADQFFAMSAIGLGIPLVAVIPFAEYAADFSEEERPQFETLLGKCCEVNRLTRKRRSNQAYLEAGHRVVDESDYLIAVWNGKPAAGKGGTADVVAYAEKKKRPILVINPFGSR
jgi:hypothetical protein